jgi:hypothetical protein
MIIAKKLLKRPPSSMLKETFICVGLHSSYPCIVFERDHEGPFELIYHII